jgi:hypothetical protein
VFASKSYTRLNTSAKPILLLFFTTAVAQSQRLISPQRSTRSTKMNVNHSTVRLARGLLIVLLLLSCWAANSRGQTVKRELTLEWIFSPEGRAVASVPASAWLDDGSLVILDNRRSPADRTFEKLNPATGQRQYFFNDGQHFLWPSERDAYMQLYRYRMDGVLENQVTKGRWALASAGGLPFWVRQTVVGIDEKNNWIYFTALEQSSVERHLYRIRPDGSGFIRISKEPGHTAS